MEQAQSTTHAGDASEWYQYCYIQCLGFILTITLRLEWWVDEDGGTIGGGRRNDTRCKMRGKRTQHCVTRIIQSIPLTIEIRGYPFFLYFETRNFHVSHSRYHGESCHLNGWKDDSSTLQWEMLSEMVEGRRGRSPATNWVSHFSNH